MNLYIEDAFVIDEICVYEGEYNDQTYAVAGDILDGVSKKLIQLGVIMCFLMEPLFVIIVFSVFV